ncbi:MAG: NUDIX hydrolase [Deltaproteobacteria bacterium]|nr:NUDIX hydrolase [Deltaproteobacteria bacterium]MBW2384420.1 NUDIX hydrolase [Deltaproteobacteria bacterium]MBW2697717.1 NUDIX hydrolase [Deltaproteobacteria bacterium]
MTTRRVYKGAMIEVVTEDVSLPNGRTVPLDLVRHPGAAAVVPFLGDDEILLIRQYRFAVGGEILEVPAGKLDPGETPTECAARELEEETGWRPGRLEHLATILTTPGFTNERIHLFAAFELEAGRQDLQHDEMIEVVPMPIDAALDAIWRGELPDAKSALALVHAARRIGRLR